MNTDHIHTFIEKSRWTFAKTMPKYPHEYTLKRDSLDKQEFVKFAKFIRSHGYDENFFKVTLRYLDFKGWKYWTMAYSLDTTILINRAKNSGAEHEHILNPTSFIAKFDC